MGNTDNRFSRWLILAAAFVVVVAGMRAATGILVPFLLAVFITVIFTPLFFSLQRLGVSPVTALLILVTVLIVLSVVFVGVVGKSLNDFSANLPGYQASLVKQIHQLDDWVKERGMMPPDQDLMKALDPRGAVRYLGTTLGAAGVLLSQAFIILLVVIFMLLEVVMLPGKVRSLPGMTEPDWERLKMIVEDIRQYMGIKTVMSAATGICAGAFCYFMEIDYPILLGLLAFLLNYIPNVGSLIAGVLAVALGLIEFGMWKAMWVASGYVVINISISNFIEPRFMGRGLGVSPMVVVMSMIFWAWVLGPIGMLLAVPLTMTLKIAMESNEDTRWISLMMNPTAPAVTQSLPNVPDVPTPESRQNKGTSSPDS